MLDGINMDAGKKPWETDGETKEDVGASSDKSSMEEDKATLVKHHTTGPLVCQSFPSTRHQKVLDNFAMQLKNGSSTRQF